MLLFQLYCYVDYCLPCWSWWRHNNNDTVIIVVGELINIYRRITWPVYLLIPGGHEDKEEEKYRLLIADDCIVWIYEPTKPKHLNSRNLFIMIFTSMIIYLYVILPVITMTFIQVFGSFTVTVMVSIITVHHHVMGVVMIVIGRHVLPFRKCLTYNNHFTMAMSKP